MTMLVMVFLLFCLAFETGCLLSQPLQGEGRCAVDRFTWRRAAQQRENEFYFEFYFETEEQEVCQNHGETDLLEGCLLKLGWRI